MHSVLWLPGRQHTFRLRHWLTFIYRSVFCLVPSYLSHYMASKLHQRSLHSQALVTFSVPAVMGSGPPPGPQTLTWTMNPHVEQQPLPEYKPSHGTGTFTIDHEASQGPQTLTWNNNLHLDHGSSPGTRTFTWTMDLHLNGLQQDLKVSSLVILGKFKHLLIELLKSISTCST